MRRTLRTRVSSLGFGFGRTSVKAGMTRRSGPCDATHTMEHVLWGRNASMQTSTKCGPSGRPNDGVRVCACMPSVRTRSGRALASGRRPPRAGPLLTIPRGSPGSIRSPAMHRTWCSRARAGTCSSSSSQQPRRTLSRPTRTPRTPSRTSSATSSSSSCRGGGPWCLLAWTRPRAQPPPPPTGRYSERWRRTSP